MRRELKLMEDWFFTGPDRVRRRVTLPHTWNAADGQDGGNDYFRGRCLYEKDFPVPDFDPREEAVYLEFRGVSACAAVILNDQKVMAHRGGYSAFLADITPWLREQNRLRVLVDNSPNRRVYPQKADFTFYGGIYRDVVLRILPREGFDPDGWGGIKITPTLSGQDGVVRVETFPRAPDAQVLVTLTGQDGTVAASGEGTDITLTIPQAHLWDGVRDPYLYTASAVLVREGRELDRIQDCFGVRSIRFDPKEGFFLNGRPYPLRGVSRHQDWKGIGSAITKAHQDRDMALIREIGANTVRLAHYQHDRYFYELCDRYGITVWAEIPYISEHLPGGRENTLSQMRELITQNYNHPSVITWGISNEITISTRDNRDMLENHRALNDLCHQMDPTRPTTLACYAMCNPFRKVVHLTDLVGYNLYLGWYLPGLPLNDLFMEFFHRKWPERCLGYSEYGAEGMPNLHSSRPRRGDHTEEYQALYHEYMLECFRRHPFLWGTYVWNMFDFAADARNQGGEPGMNHKGLVTFDRQVKKDSFYLYKAWWSSEPFVHICSRRYTDRTEEEITVKVYSNQPTVTLYDGEEKLAEQTAEKIFTFRIPTDRAGRLRAQAGGVSDEASFRRVQAPNPDYRLKKGSRSDNWV